MPLPTLHRRPALRGAALSLLYLPLSLAAAFAVAGGIGRVAPELQDRLGPPLFFSIVLVCASLGGAAWGRALAHGALPPATIRRMAIGAAVGYGLSAPTALWGLTAAETTLLLRAQNGAAVPMHVVFGAIFPAATFLVVLGTVLGLAPGLRRGLDGALLALKCAATGGAAFLLVDVGMDRAGWRVGGPDAEARLTMLVVMGAGMLAATVAAGGVLGRGIAREAVAGGNGGTGNGGTGNGGTGNGGTGTAGRERRD